MTLRPQLQHLIASLALLLIASHAVAQTPAPASLLLSGTINLHRAFLLAGDDARLVVFEGLPHAFWYDPELPEAIEANQYMAKFLSSQLK